MKSYKSIRSPRASGLNSTLWSTPLLLQSIGMPGSKGGKHLLSGNRTTRIRLHRIVDGDNFLSEPLLYCCVTFLQRAQSGTDNLASRSIGAGGNQCVDVTGLLGRQAEGSFFR